LESGVEEFPDSDIAVHLYTTVGQEPAGDLEVSLYNQCGSPSTLSGPSVSMFLLNTTLFK
jgi:hypothetical protein